MPFPVEFVSCIPVSLLISAAFASVPILLARISSCDNAATNPDELYVHIKATLGLASAGEQITLDGVQYTVVDDAGTENADKNMLKTVNGVADLQGVHCEGCLCRPL